MRVIYSEINSFSLELAFILNWYTILSFKLSPSISIKVLQGSTQFGFNSIKDVGLVSNGTIISIIEYLRIGQHYEFVVKSSNVYSPILGPSSLSLSNNFTKFVS